MKKFALSTRVSALLFAVASSACTPTRLAADEPASITPPTPPRPPIEVADEDIVPAPSKPGRSGGGSGGSTPGVPQKTIGPLFRTVAMTRSTADSPVVLITQAVEPKVSEEITEDLKVMEKLLRDAMGDIAGSDPAAMGIQLKLIGRTGPMYVEGCGAIFRLGVSWPLAAGDGAATKPDGKRRDPASKWDLARRQVLNSGGGSGGGAAFNDYSPFAVHSQDEPLMAAFEQERVDVLISSIVRTLREASNMRHLTPAEFVFVSVAGTDDRGEPVRLTLKVRKSDIDSFSGDKMKLEDFRQKISMRIQ